LKLSRNVEVDIKLNKNTLNEIMSSKYFVSNTKGVAILNQSRADIKPKKTRHHTKDTGIKLKMNRYKFKDVQTFDQKRVDIKLNTNIHNSKRC